MFNHILGHKNGLGVWVEGEFDWVDSPGWKRSVGYEEESLVGISTAYSEQLGIALAIRDAVHFRDDVYLKVIRIANLRPSYREVRLFFTHDFCVDESDIGDTTFYDPGSDALVHYKRDKWFLMSGRAQDQGIFQYANGTKRFAGAEGTWRDAEDGWLEGNPIAQGSVDSCMSFRVELEPLGERTLHYWIAAGRDLEDVRRLHRRVRREGVEQLLESTRVYWQSWLAKKRWDFKDLSPQAAELFKRSLLVIRTQIDRGGAILAANDSDILHFNRDHYSYVWPRDGALVAYALDSAGYSELTREFYRFCRRVISPGGYLWHKYHPDGSVGSSWHPWTAESGPQLPIQEDETALVLFALWHFYERERDLDFVESLYAPLIKPAADFMVNYRDRKTGLPLESYDLWEERRGVFTFTATRGVGGPKGSGGFCPPLWRRRRGGKVPKGRARGARRGAGAPMGGKTGPFRPGACLRRREDRPRHNPGKQYLRHPRLWPVARRRPKGKKHHPSDRRRALGARVRRRRRPLRAGLLLRPPLPRRGSGKSLVYLYPMDRRLVYRHGSDQSGPGPTEGDYRVVRQAGAPVGPYVRAVTSCHRRASFRGAAYLVSQHVSLDGPQVYPCHEGDRRASQDRPRVARPLLIDGTRS